MGDHKKTHLPARLRMGSHVLVRQGVVSPQAMNEAAEDVERSGGSEFDALVRMGHVSAEKLVDFLSQHYGVPTYEFGIGDRVEESALRLLGKELSERLGILPVSIQGSSVVVVCSDPGDVNIIQDIEFNTGLDVQMVVALPGDIANARDRYYAMLEGDHVRARIDDQIRTMAEEIELDASEREDSGIHDLEVEAHAAPIKRLVNFLLIDAVKRGASDIHIEPDDKRMRVRFRIDGVLQNVLSPPMRLAPPLVSRIKVISHLDLAERRMPQDGRLSVRYAGRECSFRVSVIPVYHGEKVVLRVLDSSGVRADMRDLGFGSDDLETLKRCIHMPNGLVLVTGPTGSGKTTTLYSALAELKSDPGKNVSTIEDPIEYRLPGVNQMQAEHDIGLSFDIALRALLRQDPDVIMVGEIRDFQTADMAMKAAQTGHMVLSTLHTNDAPSTVSRLVNMGIETSLLVDALSLVVAQRLVRRVCQSCAVAHRWDEEQCVSAGMTHEQYAQARTKKGVGCDDCDGSGFHGRVAAYELLPMSNELRRAILQNLSATEIKEIAVGAGMRTLRQSALMAFATGKTTLEEVTRKTLVD